MKPRAPVSREATGCHLRDVLRKKISFLVSHAAANFRFRSVINDRILVNLAHRKSEATDDELNELLNVAKYSSNNEVSSETTKDPGQCMVGYLDDTAYNPHMKSRLLKQIVLSAFPVITREKKRSKHWKT